jgi:hypothetical protein
VPTFDVTERFWRDHARLGAEEKARFVGAVEKFRDDLRARRGFRAGLRVKGVQGAEGVFEMTWADDGRATFEYGDEVKPGEMHIVWRRVGGHEIFAAP